MFSFYLKPVKEQVEDENDIYRTAKANDKKW
jgi:hypothetical protein